MIKLEVRTQGGWHRFTATFVNEGQACWYVLTRGVRDRSYEADIDPAEFPRLADLLYPTCHHGMDAGLCMDPLGENHFGTREWELAHYGGR